MKRLSINHRNVEGCTIDGDGFSGTVSAMLSVSRAKGQESKHGTVLLVEVTEGKIAPGKPITVHTERGVVSDTVGQIERERQKVPYAVVNEHIGISLKTLRPRRVASIL